MSLVKFIATPCKRGFPSLTKRPLELVSPTVFLQRQHTVQLYRNAPLQIQHKRLFHTTQIKRDMESAVKTLGAGLAAVGVIGPGIGLGVIFGNIVQAVARNPSAANKIFQFGILGAALCESVAFFALMISFIALA